jgi:hypothetical protein
MGGRVADLAPGREAEFLPFQTEDGHTRIEVHFDGKTAWLSLGQRGFILQPGDAT